MLEEVRSLGVLLICDHEKKRKSVYSSLYRKETDSFGDRGPNPESERD